MAAGQRSQALEFRALGIDTVEQLANLWTPMPRIMGGQTMRLKAQHLLKVSTDTAEAQRLATERPNSMAGSPSKPKTLAPPRKWRHLC